MKEKAFCTGACSLPYSCPYQEAGLTALSGNVQQKFLFSCGFCIIFITWIFLFSRNCPSKFQNNRNMFSPETVSYWSLAKYNTIAVYTAAQTFSILPAVFLWTMRLSICAVFFRSEIGRLDCKLRKFKFHKNWQGWKHLPETGHPNYATDCCSGLPGWWSFPPECRAHLRWRYVHLPLCACLSSFQLILWAERKKVRGPHWSSKALLKIPGKEVGSCCQKFVHFFQQFKQWSF